VAGGPGTPPTVAGGPGSGGGLWGGRVGPLPTLPTVAGGPEDGGGLWGGRVGPPSLRPGVLAMGVGCGGLWGSGLGCPTPGQSLVGSGRRGVAAVVAGVTGERRGSERGALGLVVPAGRWAASWPLSSRFDAAPKFHQGWEAGWKNKKELAFREPRRGCGALAAAQSGSFASSRDFENGGLKFKVRTPRLCRTPALRRCELMGCPGGGRCPQACSEPGVGNSAYGWKMSPGCGGRAAEDRPWRTPGTRPAGLWAQLLLGGCYGCCRPLARPQQGWGRTLPRHPRKQPLLLRWSLGGVSDKAGTGQK